MLWSNTCGGKINHKGTKERRILFCGVAAPRQRAANFTSRWRRSTETPLPSRFARDDFPHGLHVQLVLVAPGILFEKNQIFGCEIRNADAAGFQMPQARTKIVERFFAHRNKHIEGEIFNQTNGTCLDGKVLAFEFASPAFAPLLETLDELAEIFRRGVDDYVHVFSCPDKAVQRNRHTADDCKINLAADEGDQQSFVWEKVLRLGIHFWRT